MTLNLSGKLNLCLYYYASGNQIKNFFSNWLHHIGWLVFSLSQKSPWRDLRGPLSGSWACWWIVVGPNCIAGLKIGFEWVASVVGFQHPAHQTRIF